MWVYIIWCIRKQINKIIFNQGKVDADKIITLAQL